MNNVAGLCLKHRFGVPRAPREKRSIHDFSLRPAAPAWRAIHRQDSGRQFMSKRHCSLAVLLVVFLAGLPAIAFGQVTVTLTLDDDQAAEAGPDTASLTVTRDVLSPQSLTVLLNGSGTATRGTDWNGSGGNFTALSATTFRMVILPNQLSATATLTPNEDNIIEGEESFTFSISPDADYVIGSPAEGGFTIADDVAEVTLEMTDGEATEAGQTPATLVVRRSDNGQVEGALTVQMNGSGTATRVSDWNGSGGNFTALSATTFRMVILPNQLSATATLTPNEDNIIEGEESFTFSISPDADYVIGSPAEGGFTIADDVAEVTLEMTDGEATEAGQTPATLVVRRSDNGQVESTLTVRLTGSGTATWLSDWNGAGGGFTALSATAFQMRIPPNQLSATATLTPRQDAIDDGESDESFTFTVEPPGAGTSGYTIGTPDNGTFTIINFGPLVFKDGLEPFPDPLE